MPQFSQELILPLPLCGGMSFEFKTHIWSIGLKARQSLSGRQILNVKLKTLNQVGTRTLIASRVDDSISWQRYEVF